MPPPPPSGESKKKEALSNLTRKPPDPKTLEDLQRPLLTNPFFYPSWALEGRGVSSAVCGVGSRSIRRVSRNIVALLDAGCF